MYVSGARGSSPAGGSTAAVRNAVKCQLELKKFVSFVGKATKIYNYILIYLLTYSLYVYKNIYLCTIYL